MPDKIEGFLEVGRNENFEVVVNHPDLKTDENGAGHLIFSPSQARNLAFLLTKHANDAERERDESRQREAFKRASDIPVDHSQRRMLSGNPETAGHRDIDARDPTFYSGTFCCGCRTHLPLDQFVWEGTTEQVGS